MANTLICHHCHQPFYENSDNGRCPLCGWVNNPKNNALLDKLRNDTYLNRAVEKINKAMGGKA